MIDCNSFTRHKTSCFTREHNYETHSYYSGQFQAFLDYFSVFSQLLLNYFSNFSLLFPISHLFHTYFSFISWLFLVSHLFLIFFSTISQLFHNYQIAHAILSCVHMFCKVMNMDEVAFLYDCVRSWKVITPMFNLAYIGWWREPLEIAQSQHGQLLSIVYLC